MQQDVFISVMQPLPVQAGINKLCQPNEDAKLAKGDPKSDRCCESDAFFSTLKETKRVFN